MEGLAGQRVEGYSGLDGTRVLRDCEAELPIGGRLPHRLGIILPYAGMEIVREQERP